MKRLFKWLDSLNSLSPMEKAQKEWENTRCALLDAIYHQEHYAGLVETLKAREKRLKAYVSKET